MALKDDKNPPPAGFCTQGRWRTCPDMLLSCGGKVRAIHVPHCAVYGEAHVLTCFNVSRQQEREANHLWLTLLAYLVGLPHHGSPLMFTTFPQPTILKSIDIDFE